MKKNLLILFLSVLMLLICCSCAGDDVNGGNDYLYYFKGKIIEIKDENTVLVQVVKGDDYYNINDYDVNDKVYVHYKEAFLRDKAFERGVGDTDSDIIGDYKPAIGDIIAIEYFPEENSQTLNEYDYIENAGPIYKYVTVDESSESSSKE